MREARAAGLIDRFPQGRKPGLKRMKAEAAVVLAAQEGQAPAVGKSGIGEELAALTGDSIAVMREIVKRKRPYKPEMHKLKVLQKETAASALTAQIRVDENVLRAQSAGKLGGALVALLEAAGEKPAEDGQEKAPDDAGAEIVGFEEG